MFSLLFLPLSLDPVSRLGSLRSYPFSSTIPFEKLIHLFPGSACLFRSITDVSEPYCIDCGLCYVRYAHVSREDTTHCFNSFPRESVVTLRCFMGRYFLTGQSTQYMIVWYRDMVTPALSRGGEMAQTNVESIRRNSKAGAPLIQVCTNSGDPVATHRANKTPMRTRKWESATQGYRGTIY